MNLWQELKYKFQYATPVVRLIIVNSVVFVLLMLIDLFAFLFFKTRNLSDPYIALPSDVNTLLQKPWTIITFQFSHHRLFHFAFNMITLYAVGHIFMDFFKKKDVWKVFIFGGTVAGLFFVLCNNVIPVFKGTPGTLIGASGGVLAILFAATAYAPNIRLNLFGVFAVKLVWIALGYLVLDLLSIQESNAGGHIAHIGGAVFGWLFATYRKGSMQFRIFEPTVKTNVNARKFRVEVRQTQTYNKTQKNNYINTSKAPTQEEIDAILDKISKSGYDRLSKEEKDILFKASQD